MRLGEQLHSESVAIKSCPSCCWILFELDGSEVIFITFISPALWKPFMLSFLFSLFSFHPLCFPDTHGFVRLVFTGFSQPDDKLHFCWVCWLSFYLDYSCFFVSIFLLHMALCSFEFVFLHFMFCWQLKGTSRFHGLASLDDITAIISTPPLGGFQVATPTCPSDVKVTLALMIYEPYQWQLLIKRRYEDVICLMLCSSTR